MMQVPQEVRKSVVFLAYQSKDGLRLAGTAFFVAVDPKQLNTLFVYLVTAKHVIASVKRKSVDGFVHIRINDNSGSFQLLQSHIDQWVHHPEDASVDVSVLPWAPDEATFDFKMISQETFLNDKIIADNNIGIGDEVFMVGLFASHYGRQRNVPVVRIGNIACMPEEPVETRVFGPIDAYIIEARSIGGLSGSPVFVNLGAIRLSGGAKIASGPMFNLLGLIHGHWDVIDHGPDTMVFDDNFANEGRLNMGMAIVVPSSKISEVLNQSGLQSKREAELEVRRKEQSQAQGT